jgi:hypothetical protein
MVGSRTLEVHIPVRLDSETRDITLESYAEQPFAKVISG